MRIAAAIVLSLLLGAEALAQSSPSAATSGAQFSVGTIAWEVMAWAGTAFGGIITAAITAWVVKRIQAAGVQVSDSMRARLQEIVVNGLNLAAAQARTQLQGRGQVEVKNEIVANAINYTKEHGADAIKALGLDPNDGKTVEAIKARIETALADPAAPTPPEITPEKPVAAVVAPSAVPSGRQ